MIRDTTPDAAKQRLLALRRLNGEERLVQALELSDFVLRLSEAGAAQRRKDRSEAA